MNVMSKRNSTKMAIQSNVFLWWAGVRTLSNSELRKLLEKDNLLLADLPQGHEVICFTEDDIREKFAQEEQWDGLTEDLQREAVRLLMDADEYARAATVADEAIAEAVGRYLHEAMLEEEERREGSEPA